MKGPVMESHSMSQYLGVTYEKISSQVPIIHSIWGGLSQRIYFKCRLEMYTFNNSLVFRVKFTVTLFPSTKLSIPNAKGRDMFLLFSLFLHFFFFLRITMPWRTQEIQYENYQNTEKIRKTIIKIFISMTSSSMERGT